MGKGRRQVAASLPLRSKLKAARLKSVKRQDAAGAGAGQVDHLVAPFAILGPAEEELVDRRV